MILFYGEGRLGNQIYPYIGYLGDMSVGFANNR
jgi:hypothetical protein